MHIHKMTQYGSRIGQIVLTAPKYTNLNRCTNKTLYPTLHQPFLQNDLISLPLASLSVKLMRREREMCVRSLTI